MKDGLDKYIYNVLLLQELEQKVLLLQKMVKTLDILFRCVIISDNKGGKVKGYVMEQKKETFGRYLKKLRLAAGYGLRRFAALIEMKASNLCDIEHDRRAMPNEYVEQVAEALGLAQASPQWNKFFDLARKANELPADVQHVVRRNFVPALLRTIDNVQLTDDDIRKLIDEIQGRKPSSNATK